jgi:hypothetical protein
MLNPEQTMRVLLDRLNWPVRLVRWQAAKEFSTLFSLHGSELTTRVYLEWLRTRKLEAEVVSGLTVCAEERSLPAADEVRASIRKPSILADFLFQRVYRKPTGGWLKANSGQVPVEFEPESYFEEHKGQVIPLILSNEFERLEREYGPPFQRQWAYEWRRIMDETGSPYSSFPYHFMDAASSRSGIGGQFSQAQCNVYRSAYLRTLSLAVQQWDMPPDLAVIIACNCLPLNRGLEKLKPIRRPIWLADVPEESCKDDVSLEQMVRQIIKADIGTKGMRPVSLRIPISRKLAEFGELSIEACFVSDDFIPNPDTQESFQRMMIWGLSDLISFEGPLSERDMEQFRFAGANGSAIPVCLSVWPIHLGFWLNEYAHLGVILPAPYNFSSAAEIDCKKGHVSLSSGTRTVGHWKVWHDAWSPLQPSEGHTRCGGITEMRVDSLLAASSSIGMKLAWHAELKLWERPKEYGDLALKQKSTFFRD